MSKLIKIGAGLDVPVDAVTQTWGIVGIKGSGKSTTAKVLIEGLTGAQQQCVIIDPTGVWWGLKSSADGRVAGLPFTVLGGDHADGPLTADAGKLIADLAVDTPAPLVLDLSHLRKGEQARFVLAFVSELYHRNKEPLHLVIDECDLFIPQRPIKGQEQLVGAMEDLVRRGRVKGIGVSLISQRPASIHKDVLSQVSVLVAHRLVGPQDRKALDSWVEAHGTIEQRNEMMKSLAGLPAGTCWVWSPSWLDLFLPVAVRRPSTFDSMATPKAGEKRIEPKVLAQVDIELLEARLASLITEQQANDPKALRKRVADADRRIADLTAQLAKGTREPEVVEKIVDRVVEVVPPELTVLLDAAVDHLTDALRVVQGARDLAQKAKPVVRDSSTSRVVQWRTDAPPPAGAAQFTPPSSDGVSPAERKVLSVLFQHGPTLSNDQIALFSGYSKTASTIGVALRKLRDLGYVHRTSPPTITDTGKTYIESDVEPLPTGTALLDYWRNRFGPAEQKVLDALCACYPDEGTLASVAEATGYSPTASTVGVAMRKLRAGGVVDGWKLDDDFARMVDLA